MSHLLEVLFRMSSMYPSFGGAAARPCIRCGSPLGPNETQCSRCGTYNPQPQQGQQSGTLQQFQQGNTSGTWGTQIAQTPQTPQNGNISWNEPAGPAPGWGTTEQAGGWPQNSLFGGQ